MLLAYFGTLLVCFLGLIIGIIISYMAEEELRPGSSYFLLLKRMLVLIIAATLVHQYQTSIYFILGILLWLMICQLFIRRDSLIYGLFGLVFFLSYGSSAAFIITSLIIFFYGLPTASMIAEESARKGRLGWLSQIKKTLLAGVPFLAVSALLYLTKYIIKP